VDINIITIKTTFPCKMAESYDGMLLGLTNAIKQSAEITDSLFGDRE